MLAVEDKPTLGSQRQHDREDPADRHKMLIQQPKLDTKVKKKKKSYCWSYIIAKQLQYSRMRKDDDFMSFSIPKQSSYFAEAKTVPFLYHHLLECDSSQLDYTIEDHDITLRIPEGAVAEGEKVHFEVGVAMYGPFVFPENTQPISPILWLCLLEEDVQLKKPFQVILPHYLTGLSKERIEYHQVRFAKANHSDYPYIGNQMSYKFQQRDDKPRLASTGYRNYGVLISKHCCFYCLQANQTPELAMDAGYCLARIEYSPSPQWNVIHFSATFFLDTCLRV